MFLVSRSPKFWPVSLYDQPFSRHKLYWDKCIEWSPNDLGHYKVNGTLYMLLMYRSPKFHSISLYDHPFSRYKVVDNRKYTECPQNDVEHLLVKQSTLYTLNTWFRGPNFCWFSSATSCFQDTGWLKIKTRGPWTLGFCLTPVTGVTNGKNFAAALFHSNIWPSSFTRYKASKSD